MDIRELMAKAAAGKDLTEFESARAMEEIMTGQATPSQIAAYLIALRMKGETPEEIAGAARVMREKAVPVPHSLPLVVDTCGTGGGRTKTFNISTAAAFVVAGAGVPVAKHGNRSFTTQCGSADVLEALGVNLDLTPERVGEALELLGIGFLFAPALHVAMKYAAVPRRELGIDTIFNCLGPLANPARPQVQVIGVFREDLVGKVAAAMARLGTRTTLVVHGDGGLDELSLSGPSQVAEVRDGHIRRYEVRPEDVGLTPAPAEALAGATPEHNAAIVQGVLRGETGPARDVVCMNAGAALYAAGTAASIREGVRLAQESIDSGRAQARLDALRLFTHAASASAAGAEGGESTGPAEAVAR
ncbi:MAG: anthranilate phosphoribosyltransferase [Bacillota bacterium]